MTQLEADPTVLVELARARMPFGRYEGRYLVHLPEAYLVWFGNEGFPRGKLGQQMALALEIKTHGLEPMIEHIREQDLALSSGAHRGASSKPSRSSDED